MRQTFLGMTLPTSVSFVQINFCSVAGFAPGAIAHAGTTYVGNVWRSQRWITSDIATGWMRTGTDDGPAFTEIVVGDVP